MTTATKAREEVRRDASLLNSKEAQEALRHEVTKSRRSRLPVGVVFLSMHVPHALQEDPAGYAAVNQQIADRLVGSVRATDWKGQIASDAFVLVLSGLGRASDVSIVAEGVMKVMDRPFSLNGVQIYIGCSAGMAVLGTHGSSVKGLWQRGAAALLKARATGPGSCEEAETMSGAQMVSNIRSATSWRPSNKRVVDRAEWTGPRTHERYTG